jgi:hypothetical protein
VEDGIILIPQKHPREIHCLPAVVVMDGMILTLLRVVVVAAAGVPLGVPNSHENLLLEREIEDRIHHEEEVEDETVGGPGPEEDHQIFVDLVDRNRIDPHMGVDEVVTSEVHRLRQADHQGMVVAVTVG